MWHLEEKRVRFMEGNTKARLLYVQKLLEQYSDEEHPLTTSDLISMLSEQYGISAHRITLKTDIETLQSYGVDIEVINSSQNKYYIAGRKFEIPELKLLIDAVESSKFITEKKSEVMVSKLTSLVSKHQAKQLKRNLCIPDRIKPDNEMIYYIVDAINDAINAGKKISFLYFEYNAKKEKKLKNNGKPYIVSPFSLVWNGDFYYVVGYSEKHKDVGVFRVDRISKTPTVLEDDALPAPEDFNIADYTRSVFQMYGSDACEVTLRCDNSLMKYIIERFGEDVQTTAHDRTSFRAIVDVELSPTFYSWVFTFSGKVQILTPEHAKVQYCDMLKTALKANDQ